MIRPTRRTMSSAVSAILVIVSLMSSGTATLGTRSRAILATCTDRSPIRSSSVTIRSAAMMTRRSPATGCCRLSSSNADSSTFSRARSISASSADHLLRDRGVAAHQCLGGSADRDLDLAADGGQVVEDGVELLMEDVTHGPEPRQRTDGRVSGRRGAVNAG